MFKSFNVNGTDTNIEISENGKATYAVDKKKTTFDLSECTSFTYEFKATKEKIVITEDMLEETEGIEPWLWLVISQGEDRLDYNNEHAETRRHYSYSNENDKFNTLADEGDIFDHIFMKLKKEALKKALYRLERHQQELVTDLYCRDIPIVEIAERDGVNESAIRNRRKRVLKKLKKFLF